MNGVLTRHNIIASMNTRCNLIPILTGIFISVFLCVINYHTILNSMWNSGNIIIVKSGLAFFYFRDPGLHVGGIPAEIVIYVIGRDFSHHG